MAVSNSEPGHRTIRQSSKQSKLVERPIEIWAFSFIPSYEKLLAEEQRAMLEGNVFITGGAGYLARAIYQRARKEQWNCKFTCFSTDDSKHAILSEQYPEVTTIRGDISDISIDVLSSLMKGHRYVIHAAAIKYVDRAEFNVLDTIRVNINGSQNVAMAAYHAGRSEERRVGKECRL